MDKFLELPLPQRVLLVGACLAVLGGATYYLLISPVSDGISSQAKKYKALMSEYSQLKGYDSAEFKQRLEQERADAIRKRVEYSKMLPREEELPDLISSIKADADSSGLVVSRFEPMKAKEEGNSYRGLPFSLELIGSYSQLVSFLQTLAQPSKRLVNAKNMAISRLPADSYIATAGDVGMLRLLQERERARGLTPNERYARTVLQFEELSKKSLLRVEMTAMAYVYTGNAPAAVGAAPRAPGGPK
jgi:Tfp pilus assembly protein PilO